MLMLKRGDLVWITYTDYVAHLVELKYVDFGYKEYRAIIYGKYHTFKPCEILGIAFHGW